MKQAMKKHDEEESMMQHGPFFFFEDKQAERSLRHSSLPKQDCSSKRDNNPKSN
jgi:hypothetical protein